MLTIPGYDNIFHLYNEVSPCRGGNLPPAYCMICYRYKYEIHSVAAYNNQKDTVAK